MTGHPDVVVIGGGVIGLSVAWHLSTAGAKVTLFERDRTGAAASGAAAGMLAPLGEAKKPGPFLDLALASLRRYPSWVDALAADSGLDVPLFRSGLLRVATTDAEEAAQEEDLSWQQATGLRVERIGAEALRTLEPGLDRSIRAAILSSEEGHVDPPVLVRALAAAAVRRGVTILEGASVSDLVFDRDTVTGVVTAAAGVACADVVLAPGAWAPELARVLGVDLPVSPVRGQMVALHAGPGAPRHIVYAPGRYILTREGRVLIGATQEDAGFAPWPTAEGVRHLLAAGAALIPALGQARFDSAWAGLRPDTPDHLPILGRVPSFRNLHVAAGHFRNGILLAPITGALIAGSILEGDEPPLLRPFGPGRFARDAAVRS